MAHKYAATLDPKYYDRIKGTAVDDCNLRNSDAAYKRYFDGKGTFNRPSETIGILAL
jgi:hypothetical protein